jgi:hypothetical protein
MYTHLLYRQPPLTRTSFVDTLNVPMAAKPRKKVLKEKSVQIRVTEAQKATLAKAAERAGLGLSSWMLSVSLAAAAKPPTT